jgi:putative transposase
MARNARIIIPGLPHHITQRGDHKDKIFVTDNDYFIFKRYLQKYFLKYGVSVYAYCLMPNHIHIIAIPENPDSFSNAFRDVNTSYSKYFNNNYKKIGHVWQGRYFSTVLDEPHFWHAVRYVERNPVRAEIVESAKDYIWSSADSHCADSYDFLLSKLPDHLAFNWNEWLKTEDDGISLLIRNNTMMGKPTGSKDFISKIIE